MSESVKEQPQNPTLLIGLGEFGREVLEHAAPPGADGNLEKIVVSADGRDDDEGPSTEEIVADARDRCRRLLELEHYLATTQPDDPRGPRLDLFVVADLSSPSAAQRVAPLVEALAAELRDVYRPVLRVGEGALAVCPLLAIPAGSDEPMVAGVLADLAKLSAHPDASRRPQARIYVVEDQSGRYLLSRAELVRTFAGFLHLLLFSRLRDARARDLVERPDGSTGGPFATFACATLEVDVHALHRLCALKLGREVLAELRTGATPPMSEVAAEAQPLVPEPVPLEDALWQEGVTGSLEEHLEPPNVVVAEVTRTDSPEDIVEHKFGALWRAKATLAVEQFRDEVERFKMDRLAAEIERNGTRVVERATGFAAQTVRRLVAEGPRGHARALEVVRWAETKAAGLRDRSEGRIESPDLPEFPPAPLKRGVKAIEEAAFARPRLHPFRMRLFGILLGAVLTFLLGGGLDLVFGYVGWERFVPWLTWPLAALLVGSGVYYTLWRHAKRHNNWVVEARDRLDQSLKRYLNRDIVDYFRRRLHYSRLLWVLRVYRRLEDLLARLARRLEAVRAALTEADRRLSAREREELAVLADQAEDGGILFRELLRADVVPACYARERPPSMSSLAEEHLRRSLEDRDPLQAPFADPDALLEMCLEQLDHMTEASPFAAGDAPLNLAVAAGTREFLRQLALKLSSPLEKVEAVATQVRARSRRFAIVPPEAQKLVSDALKADDLGGWEVHAESEDRFRIHLLLDEGELPLRALARAGAHLPGGAA